MKQPTLPCCAALPDAAGAQRTTAGAADLWSAAGSVIAWQRKTPPLRHTEGSDPIPLSPAQERLWSLEQSEPGAPYYHIPLTWEIEGKLDLTALEKSFHFLVERHEALRTRFPCATSGPYQRVDHRAEAPLVVEDLSALPLAMARAESSQRAIRCVQASMDIEQGPLMRAVLYRHSPTDHWLMAIFHQMIFDGASMRLFNRELGQCYAAFASGREPKLEALPVTYADFSRWQLDCARQTKDSAAFWQSRLEKTYQPLRLPIDFAPKNSGVTPGAHVPIDLPKSLMDALKELAHADGITPFAAFFASFQSYLSRLTRQDDVLTFASIAARTHPALRGMIGFIANVLPLRLDLSDDPSFREVLRRAGETVSAALANQTLPLSQILECLSVSPPGASVLQTLIIYNNAPLQPLKMAEVTFKPSIELDNGTAKFDFTFDVADSPQGVSGFLKYRSDLYALETVNRLISGWKDFLRQALAAPEQPLSVITIEPIEGKFASSKVEIAPPLAAKGNQRTGTIEAVNNHRTPYAGPETETQKKLASIWESVFAIKPIGINDSFFALGGHSLAAVKLIAAIEKETGKKLRLCTIFQQPTIARLAKALEDADPRVEHSIVEIQPGGSKPPLFLVHGVGGGMFWGYNNLARELGPDQPVYGFKSRGLEGLEEFSRIEEIAEQYVRDLLKFQPTGPYYLGGYCFGGNVAYEMARQLRAKNHEVALLLLVNCWSHNSSYMRVRFSPGFMLHALTNFAVRLQHQVRRGLENPRAFLKWRAAWLVRRVKSLAARDSQERLSVEDIVNMSSQSEEERNLWRTHVQAWLRYYPQPYEGRVLLFRTRGHPLVCSFDPRMGWGELAAGGVDVHVCPGDHESILEEENVGYVAGELRRVLQRIPASLDSSSRKRFVAGATKNSAYESCVAGAT